MCLPKYRLLKSFIISLYDDTIKELMSTTELLDLIKENKIKIKNMIYGGCKHNGKN